MVLPFEDHNGATGIYGLFMDRR